MAATKNGKITFLPITLLLDYIGMRCWRQHPCFHAQLWKIAGCDDDDTDDEEPDSEADLAFDECTVSESESDNE